MRTFVALLGALALLTGCAPKDPLDRKVKASTPHELSEWWDKVRYDFSDPEQEEILAVIRFLQDYTPRVRPMTALDPYDPLCKKIHRQPLRHVLAYGYREHNRYLRNQLLNDTHNLPRLIQAVSVTEEDARREYAAAVLQAARERIDSTNERIADNDRRIAQLERQAPGEKSPDS